MLKLLKIAAGVTLVAVAMLALAFCGTMAGR
jgi:hypothetical protein